MGRKKSSTFKKAVKAQKHFGPYSRWTKEAKDKTVKFEEAVQKQAKASITGFLGRGRNSVVFSLSNGNVLDITDDKEEANNCATLKEKSLKNVVKIYDVFQLGELPIYGIVRERVEPLSSKFEALCSRLFDFWSTSYFRQETIKLGSTSKAFDYFKNNLSQNNIKLDKLTGGEELVRPVLNGLLELATNNVTFIDITYDNIGKANDGAIKIFDIGYSKNSKVHIPTIDETKQFADLKLWVESITTNG